MQYLIRFPSQHPRRGMTIPELLMVVTIVAILAGLSFAGYQSHINKAESVDAQNKLKNMYAALSSYIVDKQTWPQEPDEENTMSEDALWDWWKAEMKPYGIEEQDWYSTAHLRRLNRQLKESGGKGVTMESMGKEEELKFPSIIPTNFPPGPSEPYRYRNQPWVSETGEYHGTDGIFTIMPDGRIHKMVTMGQMNSARKQ